MVTVGSGRELTVGRATGGAPPASPPWALPRSRSAVVRTLILVGVTALVLIGLVSWAGTADVYTLIGSLGASRLLAVLLLTLVLPITHAWRLQVALLATDRRLAFGRSLRLTLAVWPISSLTPAKSGDLVKAYYLRDSVPPMVTAGALLAERAVDLAAWGSLSLVASLFFRQPVVSVFSALVLGGVLTLFTIAPWADRLPLSAGLREKLRLLLQTMRAVARRPMVLALLVGLTLANCVVTILVTAILFDGVGASVPLAYVTAAVLPAMFAGLLPFTLAGMGTRDSVMIVLFAGYASSAQALAVGLVYAFFFRWLLSLLGLPFLQQLMRTAATAERR
jgi:uncharacterized membrane protein YbhN (UPF0104 family)